MRPIAAAIPALLLAAAPAAPAAAAKQCYFSYAEFEKAVPHFDIQSCPGTPLAADKGFCRLALDGETVRVYRFVFVDKESCLERIETVPFADFAKRHGISYEAK